MALTLVSNPIIIESGITNNIFAGFLPVIFGFKREDTQVVSLGLGIDDKIRITIGEDLTSELSIGDNVYLNALGITNYHYDEIGIITAITTTTIDLDIVFIELANSGYINWKKNYSVEARIVNPDNQDIKLLPFSIIQDGDIQGNINIDVSIVNDKNILSFDYVTDQIEDSRIKFKLEYREVYNGSSNSFILINNEIILIYATDQGQTETFLNPLDNPKIYKGYPFVATFLHSDENNQNVALEFSFDELDNNQNDITSDNAIAKVDANKYGQMSVNLDKNFSFDSDTKFIRFKTKYAASLPQYNPSQYNNSQYKTS